MPRKTADDPGNLSPLRSRFNEAAARCRGKRARAPHRRRAAGASMRPRPDAAENEAVRRADRPAVSASMRPRPDAAENFERVS